jgi:acyl transferase domain-containing protein
MADSIKRDHLVRSATEQDSTDYLFVLSAANEERLQAYARKVAKWLERPEVDHVFADAIHTWQVGRVAMKQRLAIKVKDRADLHGKLEQWLKDRGSIVDAWSGEVNLRDASAAGPWKDESGQQLLDQALADRDLERIGTLWTAGAEIDWQKLHADSASNKPRRIGVPTYPFARGGIGSRASRARR